MRMTQSPPEAGGIVYGTVLNDKRVVSALGGKLIEPPHKAPPEAPVLFIKPRNTICGSASLIDLPLGEASVEIGATLGLVIGRRATRVTPENARRFVRGLTLVVDLAIPGGSLYRPPIREKCFDGSCPIGPVVQEFQNLDDVEDLSVKICIDGSQRAALRFDELVRAPARLLADVTEFMTLDAGDVLTLGAPLDPPIAGAGAAIDVEATGIGRLSFGLCASEDIAA